MGFEHRGTRQYFYLAIREGGTVRKRYLGAGPAAAYAAEQLARRQTLRQQERLEMQQRMDQLKAEQEQFALADEQLKTQIHAQLIAAGYYLHRRSEWRKRKQHG